MRPWLIWAIIMASMPISAVADERRCPRGQAVRDNLITCGECPPNMVSRHFCRWSIFMICMDDCYECWNCIWEDTKRPTPFPTRKPSPEPTIKPTFEPTLKPTEEPTHEPTQPPTVSLNTLQDAMHRMETCVLRNVLYENMTGTWQDMRFRKEAGEFLLRQSATLGFSREIVQECVNSSETGGPRLLALRDLREMSSKELHTQLPCIAFGMLYYIGETFLEGFIEVSPTEDPFRSLTWENATDHCPMQPVAGWVDSRKKVGIALETSETAEVVRMLETRLSNSQSISSEDPQEWLVPSLVISEQEIPTSFFDWEAGTRRGLLVNKNETLLFSKHASERIIEQVIASIRTNHSGIVDCSCSTGVVPYVWRVEIQLENGDPYLSTLVENSCTCLVQNALPYCPPNLNKSNDFESCVSGTFEENSIDQFFSEIHGHNSEKPGYGSGGEHHEGKSDIHRNSDAPAIPLILTFSILGLICAGIGLVFGCRYMKKKSVLEPFHPFTNGKSDIGKTASAEMVFVQNRRNFLKSKNQSSDHIPTAEAVTAQLSLT